MDPLGGHIVEAKNLSRENPETEMIPTARRVACRASQRRRSPSRQLNHSGWAMNETSCMVTTAGMPSRIGVEYAGEKKRSRLSS